MTTVLRRRTLLAATAAGVAGAPRRARADERGAHWALRSFEVEGDRGIGHRFSLLVPTHVGDARVPLLVALHGLGETHDERVGIRAWVDFYGLGTCYDRLVDAPIARANAKYRYWSETRLAEVNAMLAAQAFRGLAVCCPYTPNVHKGFRGREATLDRYADWLVDVVIPRARKEANVFDDARRTFLDGCSLGGFVGAEVMLRKYEHFGAWGTVQGALGRHRVERYAERFAALAAQHGRRPLHVETSTADAFVDTNRAFSEALARHGVAHDFIAPPGPHNQPFLRDSGTLEMLLWHDRLPR